MVLLQGFADVGHEYIDEVHERVKRSEARDAIELVDRAITPDELGALLGQSSGIVSIPRSDQLSTTLLEAMASGCSLLISDLESYQALPQHPLITRSADTATRTLADDLATHFGPVDESERASLAATANQLNAEVRNRILDFYGLTE